MSRQYGGKKKKYNTFYEIYYVIKISIVARFVFKKIYIFIRRFSNIRIKCMFSLNPKNILKILKVVTFLKFNTNTSYLYKCLNICFRKMTTQEWQGT